MFRQMRRGRQQLSAGEAEELLRRGSSGILAVHGDGGYPYAVPLGYVYTEGKIYFHCAKEGHKLDAILRDEKVSFTVVGEDTIVSEKYTSYFRSVIVFGRARVVEDPERTRVLRALAEKYSPDRPAEEREREVSSCTRALIIGIEIEHMTGKQAKEYVGQAHTGQEAGQ